MVEPIEEGTLPQYAVLRFKYPVVFIREIEKLGWYISHLGGVKCAHGLGNCDAVIVLAMDNEYWGIPFIHKLVWAVGITSLRHLVVLIPERASQVPVHEPHLISFQVLCFEIKHAVMGDEAGKPAFVIAGEPEGREASVAGPHCS